MYIRIAVGILLMSWVVPAMAYIDPGSGSAIMSAVVGLFVAIGLAVKTYWYKLKALFSSSEAKPEDESEEQKVS